jgi:hypothetical protein
VPNVQESAAGESDSPNVHLTVYHRQSACHDEVPRVPRVGQGQAAGLCVTRTGVVWRPRVRERGKNIDRERRISSIRRQQAFGLALVR